MPDPARALRDAFRRLLVAHDTLDDTRRPCGAALSLPHAHALLVLREARGAMTISELASELSIDRTNVSRLCARMEELGELQRLPNPADGRSSVLCLTARGQDLASHIDRTSAEHFGRVAQGLGPAAPEVLDALERLVQALETTPRRTDDP
jgi:DNA-binding MarR family transcriptional regulator